MPEGDTIYRAARQVGAVLVGRELERVTGSHPAIRAASARLTGSTVTVVRNHGKQHLIDTDAGYTIRTHMGMPGVWHVYRRNVRWAKPVGAARVVLETVAHEAVCFAAPTVEVERTRVIDEGLRQWGPDLTADEFDRDAAIQRIGAQPPDRLAADVLLDQRVMAGVGNVFKNELLFMHRIHPETSWGQVELQVRAALVDRARRLLMANRDRSRRITTGEARPGHGSWVYGRDGAPCRRCGTPIEAEWLGDFERVTYWCPSCQPAPAADRM